MGGRYVLEVSNSKYPQKPARLYHLLCDTLFIQQTFFVDVTEEVMETIRAAERAEAAYERKMYRYKAQYSLDC